jgi:hypothetical protein
LFPPAGRSCDHPRRKSCPGIFPGKRGGKERNDFIF